MEQVIAKSNFPAPRKNFQYTRTPTYAILLTAGKPMCYLLQNVF